MTEKQEVIDYMVSEYNNGCSNPINLAMNAADMFELYKKVDDYDGYPDWLDSEAGDICQGNY